MRISAKAEYACVAMLELASNHTESQPVRIKAIADAQGIPQRGSQFIGCIVGIGGFAFESVEFMLGAHVVVKRDGFADKSARVGRRCWFGRRCRSGRSSCLLRFVR